MMVDDAPPRVTGHRSVLTAALIVAAAAALLVRVPSIAEPLGIDQSLWASAVRGMARGQLLYQDVWEQRPPGIYFTYLLGFTLFGWTPAAVAWLDILAATATTLVLWAIVRRLSDTTTAGLAAALYALFTVPSWLYGYGGFLERSVCETFIAACIAIAAWCAVKFTERPQAVLAFAIGLASGAAVVLKPNSGLYLPALVLWAGFYGRSLTASAAVRLLVAVAAGALLVPGLTVAWLWRLDLLREAKIAVVDFNRFYVGQGFSPAAYAVDFSKAVFLRMKTDPLWLAGGIGSMVALWDLARRRRLPPMAGLAVLWGGAAALVIIVNGARLFNSYFIQALPPLAVLAAWTLTHAAGSSIRRGIAMATAVMMIGVAGYRSYVPRVVDATRADLDGLRGRMDRMSYLERFGGYANDRGYSARANAELADHIRAHTSADEKIFLFGINGAGIYFDADRRTAHRFLRVNFFVPAEFPDPRFTLEAVAADLRNSRPRYLIFEQLHAVSPRGAEMARIVDGLPQNPILAELLQGYQLETTIEDFTLYRRVD
jgi:4-amino-4-deoxy-L-arabinose transferase-like glycosyltransferase